MRIDANVCSGFFKFFLHDGNHIASDTAALCKVHARSGTSAVNALVKIEVTAHFFEPAQSLGAVYRKNLIELNIIFILADFQRVFNKEFRTVLDPGFFLLMRALNIHAAGRKKRAAADDRHFFEKNGFMTVSCCLYGGSDSGSPSADDDDVSGFCSVWYGILVYIKILGYIRNLLATELHIHIKNVAVVAVRKT